MAAREFQVIIFGATGFAGELLAEYFVKFYLKGESKIKFAIAGRNKGKLEAVREKLCAIDEDAYSVPIVLGDSGNMEQMRALALRTEVVATLAGPYALYGSTLLEACASAGTSYCDLTGECAWVDLMHAQHHKTAEENGAHIVPCSGFDSVPSDLGTFLVAQQFKKDHGEDCDQVDNYVVEFGGGFQGGTVNTIMNELSNPTKKPPRDPNAAAPLGKTKISWTKGLWYDSRIGRWTIPFLHDANQRPSGAPGQCTDWLLCEHDISRKSGIFIPCLAWTQYRDGLPRIGPRVSTNSIPNPEVPARFWGRPNTRSYAQGWFLYGVRGLQGREGDTHDVGR